MVLLFRITNDSRSYYNRTGGTLPKILSGPSAQLSVTYLFPISKGHTV